MQDDLPAEGLVATLVAPRRIEFVAAKLPELGAGDILCRTLVTAISPGTELAAYTGAPPLRDGIGFPRLLGYCNVARVIAVGNAVKTLKPGDRVLTFASHRSHFVMAEGDVPLRLSAEARDEDVVCAYLFHLGYNAVLRSGVRAGSRVFVIGLGALGLTSVALAALAGAKVSALTDQPKPAAIASGFGAAVVHDRAGLAAALEGANPVSADVVISTTNAWADWEVALRVAAQRGTIAVLGFPGRGQQPPASNPLDSRFFYTKQLRIEAVGVSPEKPDDRGFNRFNARDNLAFLAEQITTGRLDARALVSGIYEGKDIENAYLDLLARKDSPITYILRWTRD